MSERDATAPNPAELQEVPIFPLPRIVLFPGTRLPLHVFEPRYREMMADCNARGESLIAVARLTGDWKREYYGNPPIDTVAGLGRIEAQHENPDGTFDIELEGVARARLLELPREGRSYRRAHVELLRERVPSGRSTYRLDASEIRALYSLATQVAAEVKKREPRFALLAAPDDAPSRLVDRIADQFLGDPDVRQDLLETLDVKQRFVQVASRLSHLHLSLLASERDDEEDDKPKLLH